MIVFSRPFGATMIALVLIAGFAIGAWLAVLNGARDEQARRVTVATNSTAPIPVPAVARTAMAKSVATPVPTVAATVARHTASRDAWQVAEANVQVGTIVWSGAAVLSNGSTMALDLHKESVGGRRATRCERHTDLRAAFSLRLAEQTVPYREVNCAGVASTGEMRLSSMSSDGRSFSGSFWRSGVKLGNFDALRQ